MERLFNDDWLFTKLPNGSTLEQARQAEWQQVSLPHDFLIWDADNLYENCDGWYRRVFVRTGETLDKQCSLRFDGVYMDCDVLFNGEMVASHPYGYTAFDVPLGRLKPGFNEVIVHVRHQSPNSRWYSGAGIYRDVTFFALPDEHIVPDGLYVVCAPEGGEWRVRVETEISAPAGSELLHRLLDEGEVVAEARCLADAERVTCELRVASPRLWSCDAPHCYTLETTLGEQVLRQHVGLRTLRLDRDEGLFVNDRHVKLHGVCLHHDLGALGAAFHEKAARRQLQLMKDMGVNSLRTSHNPPARQVMDLCDEMGILVVSEAFDMWERPKTTYDYARFFKEHHASDVAGWVRRDRNHPSLLMWSIGNEILDCHADERGYEVTAMLAEEVRLHDPQRNGFVTFGSNFMPWEGAQRCADLVEAVGYNYGEKYYEAHREAHPSWVIYGSETASALSSRGVYRFPRSANILSDEDLQCSSLGNSLTAWGTKDMRRLIVDDLKAPWSLGQYLWSGIDYIGEPTPYHTRNCYFGMADTACLPKDYWYLFRAMWRDEPMIHIGVYWDWNPGQTIDVPVMTNCAEVELFLNGRSLGRKAVDRLSVEDCMPVWRVPYEAGELKAVGYDACGNVQLECLRVTPGDPVRLLMETSDEVIAADGRDLAFVTISAVDAVGNPVDNACCRVTVTVSGGVLAGLDNGDSTDRDGYKTNTRRLFSGKLVAMVASDDSGPVRITAEACGLETAALDLGVRESALPEGAAPVAGCCEQATPDEQPIRKIELIPVGSKALTPENPCTAFRVKVWPEDAPVQDIDFRMTTANGIDTPCARVARIGDEVSVFGCGDGEVWLRATCRNGYDHTRVISQQDLSISGMGMPYLDPYEMVSAGLYTISDGEIGAGNEQGVAFARDGFSFVGFENVDFGPVGSDTVELPIFALDDKRYEMSLWLGDPSDEGRVLCRLPYQKPSRWNVYQPETYTLPERLTGVHTIAFSMDAKVHLKGFRFQRQSRAWQELSALQADHMAGDSFRRTEHGVEDIGNNVSLMFANMDFGDCDRAELVIDGATTLNENPVTIRFENEAGEQVTSLARFVGGGRGRQRFEVDVLRGMCSVTFVFLPGSRFDFYGFRFGKLD